MNWLARLFARYADLIIAFAQCTPYTHIHDVKGDLYMGRWWLIKERSWLPIAARIHHIARPDNDRHLHDHPCDYRTFVLRGFYVEHDLNGRDNYLEAGQTVAHRAQHFHTIKAVSKGGVWTLFVYRNRHQPWGFLVNDRKVFWKKYLYGENSNG